MSDDMATMPIRELIPELKARAKKLGDQGNLVDCLVINTLANRMAQQADIIDELKRATRMKPSDAVDHIDRVFDSLEKGKS